MLEDLKLEGLPELYSIPPDRWIRIQETFTADPYGSFSFRGHGHLSLSKMAGYEIDYEGQRVLTLSEGVHLLTMATHDMKSYEDAVVVPYGRAKADLTWGQWDWGYSMTTYIPVTSFAGNFMYEVMEGRRSESYAIYIDINGCIRSVRAADTDVTRLLCGTKDKGEEFLIDPILEFIEHALEKRRVMEKCSSSESSRSR